MKQPGARFPDESPSRRAKRHSFCGYHSHLSYNGTQIKYAVYPYPDCSGCKLSSLTVADMLTIVNSNEIQESATEPVDLNTYAWYDSAGYKADDNLHPGSGRVVP
jgi:hypothetical protein